MDINTTGNILTLGVLDNSGQLEFDFGASGAMWTLTKDTLTGNDVNIVRNLLFADSNTTPIANSIISRVGATLVTFFDQTWINDATLVSTDFDMTETTSTAGGNLGRMRFIGKDSAGTRVLYGQLLIEKDKVATGSQSGAWFFNYVGDGTISAFMTMDTLGLQLADGAGAAAKAGFFGKIPIVQQTGVTIDAASIHRALVDFGLIT